MNLPNIANFEQSLRFTLTWALSEMPSAGTATKAQIVLNEEAVERTVQVQPQIDASIGHNDHQLAFGKRYDHNFILDPESFGLRSAQVKFVDPKSGRTLVAFATEAGIQLYSGNFLHGRIRGKAGKIYPRR
jgi:galactose mutarotase-like enzyme